MNKIVVIASNNNISENIISIEDGKVHQVTKSIGKSVNFYD